ncbi:MAG TPA: MipA/OmpV family protein [Sphingomonas sp.]|jgi:outer membrane protein|nr:MipA/OmpV family protein [Sphingomonas sp.]
MMLIRASGALALLALVAAPALAQEKQPRRVRVGLGPQVSPAYPGADEVRFGPYVNVDVARGDTPFAFEAQDESFGFPVINTNGIGFGPSLNVQGSRKNSDVGAPIGKVKTTVEAGGFVHAFLSSNFRVRAELRRGLGGHDGFVGEASADFIARDGDRYVFSIGPRVVLSNAKYQRAYLGVDAAQSAATGLPRFTPKGGLQSVGGTAGLTYQFTRRWGVMSYVRYDRLVSDAADSPVVRQFGTRDQFSGGLGLTYTFGG